MLHMNVYLQFHLLTGLATYKVGYKGLVTAVEKQEMVTKRKWKYKLQNPKHY